jgi:hypothetical protein
MLAPQKLQPQMSAANANVSAAKVAAAKVSAANVAAPMPLVAVPFRQWMNAGRLKGRGIKEMNGLNLHIRNFN